jgi:predicted RND superfamily exporter protein
VLAFNICLGIAVDDTVQFLNRYRRELAVDHDRQAAIRRTFRAVAPVMVTTTILMLAGFGAGLACSIPTIQAFSAFSCLALVFALLSEAVILPALLFCLADFSQPALPPWMPLEHVTPQSAALQKSQV